MRAISLTKRESRGYPKEGIPMASSLEQWDAAEICSVEECDKPKRIGRYIDGRCEPRCRFHGDLENHKSFAVLQKDERGGYVSVSVHVVHEHSCPFWRMGRRHAPCNCGAHEAWTNFFLRHDGTDTPGQVWDAVRDGAVEYLT
jgi:hypothetical protein